ncbi:MAG TPA: Ig-like domain-containing protein, partial [Cyclobacteriaceae bacterium]|nr:Ig-like domain-containing protein [Cyclobacteriaceae bacterium]
MDPIFEGALTQTVVVRFSEPMNASGSFNPAITLTGTNWGAQAAGNWSTTTFTNDTYTTTFVHNATQETIAAATATINANTPKDLAGNNTTNAPQSSAPFVVDNLKPTATIGLSSTAINTNTPSLTLTVTYNEPMDNTQFPAITFNPANGNLSAPSPTMANWNPAKTVFTITYTHDLTPETIPSVTARANGAIDTNGNAQTALSISPAFAIDTQRPSASISTNDANGYVKEGQAIVISATFSEPMADAPVVRIAMSGANTLPPTNMTKVSTTLYTYNHVVAAGNGTITFSLSVGTDVAGNIVQSTPTAGATIIADNTPPILSSLSPPDNSHNRQVGENLSIALADANTGILKGSGTISLFMAGGTLVESFDMATSPLVTISPSNTLVINPTLDLAQATAYYVIIPSGAITDLAGNPFAGFALDTDWNFVTFGPPMVTGV